MAWMRVAALLGSLSLVCSVADAKSELLPLKRVRFYETGVAYFERSGAVGQGAVTLPVPASHLDDALKTLVVYAKDGPTRLGGVEFASSVSRGMARALAGIGPGHGRLGLLTLLESLKGASVELELANESLTGRLVEVLDESASDLRVREAEVARFREHARALGSARGTEDVVARLLAAEDRAETLRRSIRVLAAEADALARRASRTLTRLGA